MLRCLLWFAQSIVYDKNAINFFLVLNINSFIIFNLKEVIVLNTNRRRVKGGGNTQGSETLLANGWNSNSITLLSTILATMTAQKIIVDKFYG